MPSAEPDSQETEGLLEQAAAGDSLARERLLQCHRCSGSAAARAVSRCHVPAARLRFSDLTVPLPHIPWKVSMRTE